MTTLRLTALIILATLLAGCGFADSEINEIGLIYSGGLVEDKEYQGLLEAGSTNNQIGVGSTVYRYPTDQRSWVTGQDAEPIDTVSDDGIRLRVPYQLYFKLNIDEDTLRAFHENIGIKTEAWTREGWVEMLNTYFDPQVDRAIDEAALKFQWRELFASEETRVEFQREVVTSLQRKINEVVGGDYFCGPQYNGPDSECGTYTFTVGKPEPTNPDLVKAIEQEQVNQTRVAAQEAENLRIEAELKAKQQEVALYGPEVYAWLKAIDAAREAGVAPPPFFPPNGDNPLPIVEIGSGGESNPDN